MSYEIDVVVALHTAGGHFLTEGDSLMRLPLPPAARPSQAASAFVSATTGVPANWFAARQVGLLDEPGIRKTVLFEVVVPEKFAVVDGFVWTHVDQLAGEALRHAALSVNYLR